MKVKYKALLPKKLYIWRNSSLYNMCMFFRGWKVHMKNYHMQDLTYITAAKVRLLFYAVSATKAI